MMNDKKENNKIQIPLARPNFGETEPKVAFDVVKSRWLIFGPKVKELEAKFAKMMDAKHAIAINSGSSALYVAYKALGIGPGDEVIVPNMTFISTASAVSLLGATPVFADINMENYCMDPKDIEKRITSNTKAIAPVHYAGHSADMDEIKEIAKKHDLKIVEDAAEAHLSEYKGSKVGTIGDIGIFSFTPSKPMTTGEGGMIVTNDDELAKMCRLLIDFGDTDKFKWDYLGFNFRLPEVMGAIGLEQLGKLEGFIEKRREIAKEYSEGLSKIKGVIVPKYRDIKDINFQVYTIRFEIDDLDLTRDEIIVELQKKGVSTRLYYPPLHNQKVFGDLPKMPDSDYPNTLDYCRSALCLPMFTEMTSEQIKYTVEAIEEIVTKHRRN